MGGKITKELFVKRLYKVYRNKVKLHGKFSGMKSKPVLVCYKHGKWDTSRAADVIRGHGCPKCKGESITNKNLKSNENYIKQLKLITKDITPLEKYKGSSIKIKFKCRKCNHTWKSRPNDKLKGVGCPLCSKQKSTEKRKTSNAAYKQKLKKLHKGRIVALESYAGTSRKIKLKCSRGHLWAGYPYRPCPICYREDHSRNTTVLSAKEAQKFLIKSHKGRIRLIEASYINTTHPARFKCRVCKTKWELKRPYPLLSGEVGCPVCSKAPPKVSKISIEWLQWVEKTKKIKLQRSGNGTEKCLYGKSGKRYYADGYCEETKTVYEFNGDMYHGNPEVFKPRQKSNPFSNLTAKMLHTLTKRKEEDLKQAGYKVISIWERDWITKRVLCLKK